MLISSKSTASTMLVVLILLATIFLVDSRSVNPIFESIGTDSLVDLQVAAAEPRPVVIDVIKHPEVLPLVYEDDASFEDSPLSASEKVEKVLRRPFAFSYRNKEPRTSSSETRSRVHGKFGEDQKPSAINYYKYIDNLEKEEKNIKQTTGDDKEFLNAEAVEQHEDVEESEEHAASKEAATSEDAEEENDRGKSSEEKQSDESDEPVREDYGNFGHENLKEAKVEEVDDTAVKEEQQDAGDHESVRDGEEDHSAKGSHEHADVKKHEAAASHHHDKKHGGGGNGHYKKGGGKTFHSDHKSSHGEKGDKGYKGEHHHEKGEKGHHNKEKHNKHYDEHGGHKKKHHHDDGYHAEKHHGEKGEKGHKFEESGEHKKGHSTKGEHNIRKVDEYEKKQEFFDESHEEGDFEKDGGYYNEHDYKKGGHEKGGYEKGAKEEGHHGQKKHHEKGGHFKDDKGHKEAAGHDEHHDHHQKHGKKEEHSGGKKWHYKKGDGHGGDSHGKHSEQQVVSATKGNNANQPAGESEASSSSIEEERSRILLSPMLAYNGLHNAPAHKYAVHEVASNEELQPSHIVLPLEDDKSFQTEDRTKKRRPRKKSKKFHANTAPETFHEAKETFFSADEDISTDPNGQRRFDADIFEETASLERNNPPTQTKTNDKDSEILGEVVDNPPNLPLDPLTLPDAQQSRNAEIQAIKRSVALHEKTRRTVVGISTTEDPAVAFEDLDSIDKRYDEILSLIRGTDDKNQSSKVHVAFDDDNNSDNNYKTIINEKTRSEPVTVATYVVRKQQPLQSEFAVAGTQQHIHQGNGFCGTVVQGPVTGTKKVQDVEVFNTTTKNVNIESQEEPTSIAPIVIDEKVENDDQS